jgi:hypothetical protein
MSDELARLQRWYADQCEEETGPDRTPWQHRYGVQIQTIDNPGWSVGIDLVGTTLEGATMPMRELDNGDEDWCTCGIHEGRLFSGVGDPSKLTMILAELLRLAEHVS